MQTASSAKRTWRPLASAVEWTATVRMPSSRQARMTRRAISPRLATRTFLNMTALRRALGGLDAEKRLPELHRLAVLDQDLGHLPRLVRLDLVHQLHRLDDAEGLALPHHRAHLDERRLVRGGSPVEGPDEGRRHQMALLLTLGCCGWSGGCGRLGRAHPRGEGDRLHGRKRRRV